MMEYYNKKESIPVVVDNKKNNILLRKVSFPKELNYPEGVIMELQTKEVLPTAFYTVCKNMEIEQLKWNKHCSKCFVSNQELDVMVTLMKAPFPLTDRILMSYRHFWEFPEKEEYILIFSGMGCENEWKEYISKNDVSKFVVGFSLISAYWF